MSQWTIEEKHEGSELSLSIREDDAFAGIAYITLYDNGPCLKTFTITRADYGVAVIESIIEYMEKYYYHDDGLFAYVHDHSPHQASWLRSAGFKFFKNMDGGKTMYYRKLTVPVTGLLVGFMKDLCSVVRRTG